MFSFRMVFFYMHSDHGLNFDISLKLCEGSINRSIKSWSAEHTVYQILRKQRVYKKSRINSEKAFSLTLNFDLDVCCILTRYKQYYYLAIIDINIDTNTSTLTTTTNNASPPTSQTTDIFYIVDNGIKQRQDPAASIQVEVRKARRH